MNWSKLKTKLIKEDPPKKKADTFIGRIWENIKSFGWALIIALIIKSFVVEATTVPTGSMENTIMPGDFLFINKFIYGAEIPFTHKHLPGIKKPDRGDIIVFRYPNDPSVNFVKRCVALAGDTVEIINKQLFINGKPADMPKYAKYEHHRIYPRHIQPRDNFGPYIVPEKHYFAMGDNRDNSNDSRYWGPVPDSLLKGQAMIIYWSWNKEIPFWKPIKKLSSIRLPRIGKIVY